MKVTVAEGFRVAHNGTAWTPGDTAEVPTEVGNEWVAAGWVTYAEPVDLDATEQGRVIKAIATAKGSAQA